ncbi:hypothetical protein V8E53_005375 [Lactarius tabidus]|jgi:hypothetical protein
MTLTHFLTDDERNTAFWCGFHPDNCIRLLPYSPDIPPHFKNVFTKAQTVFLYKPEPVYMPIHVPASPLPTPLFPSLPTSEPHPSPKHPPKICRPASAPPIAQCFNDLGEGDLCCKSTLATSPERVMAPMPTKHHAPSSVTCTLFAFAFAHPFTIITPFSVTLALPSVAHPPIVVAVQLIAYPVTVASINHSCHDVAPTSPSQLIPSPSPAFPTCSSLLHDSSPILSHSPLLSIRSPSPSPLSVPDVLPIILLPLDPVTARLLPLPPNLSPMLSPSPSLIHAATSSPPSHPSFPLALLLQLLNGPHMSPRNGPLRLAFPPSPLHRPPDLMPAGSIEPQSPAPAPSPSSALPSQSSDCTRTARPQPPPPRPSISSPTEATNAITTHHEWHHSKQPTNAFEPQNRLHPHCRHYCQRLQQRDFQYRYPLTPPQARRPRLLPRHPHHSRMTSIPHVGRQSQSDQ